MILQEYIGGLMFSFTSAMQIEDEFTMQESKFSFLLFLFRISSKKVPIKLIWLLFFI